MLVGMRSKNATDGYAMLSNQTMINDSHVDSHMKTRNHTELFRGSYSYHKQGRRNQGGQRGHGPPLFRKQCKSAL